MENDKLKPCPFCGSEVHIKRDEENILCFIVCSKDSTCQGSDLHVGFTPEKEETAIKAWNTRVRSDQTEVENHGNDKPVLYPRDS